MSTSKFLLVVVVAVCSAQGAVFPAKVTMPFWRATIPDNSANIEWDHGHSYFWTQWSQSSFILPASPSLLSLRLLLGEGVQWLCCACVLWLDQVLWWSHWRVDQSGLLAVWGWLRPLSRWLQGAWWLRHTYLRNQLRFILPFNNVWYVWHPIQQVCGKILAYQYNTPDAYSRSGDSNYVDGVSLTHSSPPRQHIWTFVAAWSETEATSAVHAPVPAQPPHQHL